MRFRHLRPAIKNSAEAGVWLAAGGIHLLFWLSLRWGWLDPLFNDPMHRFGPGCDFFALYLAGHNAVRGESIYAADSGADAVPYGYPFRYLPITAFTAGILFTLVPPIAAYALWLGVCEFCLLLNVRETYRRAGGGLRGALLGAAWLTFAPYYLELWVGQFTFVLGTLLFWCVLRMEEGRWRTAQALWIGSVLWKPASLLWIPLWIRERRYHPGLAVLGAFLLLDLTYFLSFPDDWPLFLQTNLNPLPTWHAGNIGLSALIYHFTSDGALYRPVRATCTLLLLLPALWITFRPCIARLPLLALQKTRPAPSFWLISAIWTTLYFLLYKDVWEHHLTLLLPFLVFGLWQAPSRRLLVIAVLLALPSPFVLYDPPGLGYHVDPQPYFSYGASLLHHSWRVAPLLALYGAWLRLAGAER